MTAPYTITIAGQFQQGKSTLLNCLLGKKYAETGNGLATTRESSCFRYGSPESRRKESNRWEYVCDHPLLRSVSLVDTPGFNADKQDDATAKAEIRNTDAVLLLAEKDLGNLDRDILKGISIYSRIN